MKNLGLLFCCYLYVMTLSAQLVSTTPFYELSSQGSPPFTYNHYALSDCNYAPFFHYQDSTAIISFFEPQGLKRNAFRCLQVRPRVYRSFSSTYSRDREVFHQTIDSNYLSNYYVEYGASNIKIARQTYTLDELRLIKDTVFYTIPDTVCVDRFPMIVHAMSPNGRYLAYDFVFIEQVDNRYHMAENVRLRLDLKDERLDYLDEPLGNETRRYTSKPQLQVTNQGDVLEIVHNETDLDGLKEVFVKEDINFFDYSDEESYFFVDINHFPLHSRGSAQHYLLDKKSPFLPSVKLLDDHFLVLYGFSTLDGNYCLNTVKYDIFSQNFVEPHKTLLYKKWNSVITYDSYASLSSLQYVLEPIGLESLNDGSYVVFANWVFSGNLKTRAYKHKLDFHANILHCVLDSTFKVIDKGVHYNEFLSSSDHSQYNRYANGYTATDGEKAVLFIPITKLNWRKKTITQRQHFSNRTCMKVVTVDAHNNHNDTIMRTKAKYEYIINRPKYDVLNQDWIVTLLSSENTRLERWKIK